jgi:peptide/nickel transport system substrate-binding protein
MMSIRKSFIVFAALSLATAIVPLTMSASSAATKKAQTSGTVTIGCLCTLTAGWDPYKTSYGNLYVPFFGAAYATLMDRTNSGAVAPGLAESWSYPTKLTFQMKLRPNLKFANGEPLNAAAVKQNIERVVSGKVVGPTTNQLSSVTKVTTTGANIVTLTLNAVDPALPLDFTQMMGEMVAPAALNNPSDLSSAPYGAGPYVLDASSTTPGSLWTFTRNPNYYAPSAYPYSSVIFKYYATDTTALSALQTGQIDVTRVSSNQVAAAKGSGLSTVGWLSAINGLWIDDRTGKVVPALKNVLVRQAINYAINKQAVIKVNGGGTPESSMFWKGSQAYVASASNYYSYNPGKAKKLLKEAGYAHGLKISFLSDPFFDSINQVILADLQAVGIDASINDQTTNYENDLATSPLAYFFWFPQNAFNDAKQLLLANGGYNFLHTNDPEVTKLFNVAANATSTAAATKDWQALNLYIVKEAWFAPIFNDGSQYFVSNAQTKVTYIGWNDWPALQDITPIS